MAEQQQKYDQCEAELAQMSAAERATLYGEKAGSGIFKSLFGDLVDMLKAFPGFYVGYLKTVGKIALLPSQLSGVMAESVATGSLGPLQTEIDKIVKPIARTHEEAKRYKGILQVLLTDKDTLELLHDFAQRYYDATHPLELIEMGASAATDIVVTVLLAIFTLGVGAAANAAAKSTKLVKVAKLLERLADMLKRTGYKHKLPKKHHPGSGVVSDTKQVTNKSGKGGVPKPEKPKGEIDKVVDKAETNRYKDSDRPNVPKTTQKPDPKRNKIPEKIPDELYEDIRNSKTDVANIAKHNNLKPERIQKIKDYVFNNPKFESDPNTAKAWMRLAEGKGTAHDKFLLKHETTELFYKDWIKNNPEKYLKKYDPLDAHEITNEAGFKWEGGLSKRGPRNKDL